MTLLVLADAQLAFGMLPLLDRANLVVQAGERIGLIGRNGTGKSSLLGAIAGTLALDEGEVRRRDGLRVALVEQEPRLPPAATLAESLVARARAGAAFDEREPWRFDARLAEYLHRFGLETSVAPAQASGGEAKRAALALAFALEPDLILLDEPTNHIDIDGIVLLEGIVARGPAAIIVTHDRAFLDRAATRIVELDRGMLRSYSGNFSAYERVKADELAAEAGANRRFDKFWAQEEAWIRKGVEARRTRNEGRVRRLERLREERSARRERPGAVRLAIDAGETRSGRIVAELEGIGKRFDARWIVRELSLTIRRGDRIGLVGANGAGKSTLIKLILGALAPDAGRVRLGANVLPAYFDQMREQLDPDRTVVETISPGSDWIEINGTRKHVMGYLADFLFPPRRAQSPVRMLSGGERNRLLLARLFARPANVLVLDEPTNDLDIESLELLEQALQEFPGTLLLVSHDRAFLDNVVTQTLAAEGDGAWREYVGGYSDWRAQRAADGRTQRAGAWVAARETPPDIASAVNGEGAAAAQGDATASPAGQRPRTRTKLSYKASRELAALPAEIEALEAEQKALAARMSDADYYRQSGEAMRNDHRRSEEIEALLLAKLERWEALEAGADSPDA